MGLRKLETLIMGKQPVDFVLDIALRVARETGKDEKIVTSQVDNYKTLEILRSCGC